MSGYLTAAGGYYAPAMTAQQLAGLGAHAGNAGPDYVDYGAYTGGYGAYGWYTDHPVLIDYHH